MTILKSSLCCFLCQGTISVRSENLDKFKSHLENVHDVFYDHGILVAINFLEAHEKEVIMEKVLPRIKQQFENMQSTDVKHINGGKLGIEKRLYELDESSENGKATKKYKTDNGSSDIVEEKNRRGDSLDHDKITEQYSDDESEAENDAVSVGETLDKSIEMINDKPEDEFTICDICNQSVRKTILSFHLKSHNNSTAECIICRKVMQKRSLQKHMRRCEIMKNLSKYRDNTIAEQDENDIEDEMASMDEHEEEESKFQKIDKISAMKSSTDSNCPVCNKQMLKGNIRRHIRLVHGRAKEDFKCKICFVGFQQLDSLEIHTYKEHNLDLEDMEQMLQEKSGDESRMGNETLEGSTNIEPVDETKKFKCEQCDNVYTSKDSVRRHRRKAHL